MNAAIKHIEELVAPPFHSAEEAVRFAVTRMGRPTRPLMNSMMDKTPIREGLSGLDAAAQAGMILSALHKIGPLKMAVLIARTAPHSFPCACRNPCCSGRKVNWEWREAIDTLSRASVEGAKCKASPQMRLAIAGKLYAESANFKQLAARLDCDVDTFSDHFHRVRRWVQGTPPGKHGEPATEGLEAMAWREAEQALRDAEIVG